MTRLLLLPYLLLTGSSNQCFWLVWLAARGVWEKNYYIKTDKCGVRVEIDCSPTDGNYQPIAAESANWDYLNYILQSGLLQLNSVGWAAWPECCNTDWSASISTHISLIESKKFQLIFLCLDFKRNQSGLPGQTSSDLGQDLGVSKPKLRLKFK